MKIFSYITAILLLLTSNSFAANWEIDKKTSKIEFKVTYNGRNFNGKFDDFAGEIAFDPNNLAKSFAKIKVNLKSVKTGDATNDKTLEQDDWFNSNKTQFATFETTKISNIQGEKYQINGFVTIRNIKIAHNFEANIKITGNKAVMIAKTKLKRLDFDIGKASDKTGSWVSIDIPMDIEIRATAKP